MVMRDISRSWDKEKKLDSQTRLLTGAFPSSHAHVMLIITSITLKFVCFFMKL